MKEGVNKRGLSPTVASALLVLLVLVLALIIFLWARGFIGEQIEKFGEPIEKSCGKVNLEIASVGENLEVLNNGEVDVRHLDVRMTRGGDTVTKRFDFSIDKGEFRSEGFSFSMLEGDIEPPEEIIVYPALVGRVVGESSNGVYTCVDSGVIL